MCVWPSVNLQVLHICNALTEGSTRLMKTGSKYIYSDGRRMELWIMTAWLADNRLLTCLTYSWTVCLPAWLLLRGLFVSLTYLLPCTHLFVSALIPVHLWLYCMSVSVSVYIQYIYRYVCVYMQGFTRDVLLYFFFSSNSILISAIGYLPIQIDESGNRFVCSTIL